MSETQKHQNACDLEAKKSAATLFIESIQNSGGTTYPLGPISDRERTSSKPSTNRQATGKAPDIGFSFPGQPLLIAQIQEMHLTRTSEELDPHFVLSNDQYFSMIDAANSFHTLYFIYCDELDYIEGLSAFSFVSFADFQNRQRTVSEPMIGNSSHSILPLSALKPLYELSGCGGDEKLQMADNRKRVRLTAKDYAKKAESVPEALARTSKVFRCR